MKKILVIGDAIIDTNLYGECHRISPEAPVPVIKFDREVSTIGGAANVAAHISNAGIECIFAYKRGEDEFRNDLSTLNCPQDGPLESLLKQYPLITTFPLPFDSKSNIPIKKRVLAGTQQICRIDFEDTEPPDKDLQFQWYLLLAKAIKDNDIGGIIFSDYNKGTLTDDLIQMIVNLVANKNIFTILDPKRPSFMNLKRLTAVKPNGNEIPATNKTAQEISWTFKNTALVNTIGADGVKIWIDGIQLYHMPSVATNVVDVCGAGDSFHSVFGIGLLNNLNLAQAVAAGNKASSYAISNRGTYVLTRKEIDDCLAHGLEYLLEN